jgi:hypothetical protein
VYEKLSDDYLYEINAYISGYYITKQTPIPFNEVLIINQRLASVIKMIRKEREEHENEINNLCKTIDLKRK